MGRSRRSTSPRRPTLRRLNNLHLPLKNMKTKPNTSRRRFLAGAAGAIAAPTIIPSSVLGKDAPSNRVQMGFVGMGNRGRGVMTALANHEKAQGIAVCDLHKAYKAPNGGNDQGLDQGVMLLNKANAKKGGSETGVKGYADYREMIAKEKLDAIMVATPDHWHALVCMEAARADCDIYCEKPITHLFAEGYHLHREIAKRDLIFQVGSQQRSDRSWHGRQGGARSLRRCNPGDRSRECLPVDRA